jgi:hypothetical protein
MKEQLVQHDFQVGEYPVSYFISPAQLSKLIGIEKGRKFLPELSRKYFADLSMILLESTPKELTEILVESKRSSKSLNILHAHGDSDKSFWKYNVKGDNYKDVPTFLNSQDAAGWMIFCCNPGGYELIGEQMRSPVIYPADATTLAEIGTEACPLISVGKSSNQGDLETALGFLGIIHDIQKQEGVADLEEFYQANYCRAKQSIEKAYSPTE